MKNKEFLQSREWQHFQESVGRKAYFIENEGFLASIIEHTLPIVGKYLYCPRGPVISNFEFRISNETLNSNDENTNSFKIQNSKFKIGISELILLAKKCNAGWVRIEPENEEVLKIIRESIVEKVVKAPHDMQPKEVFVIDITKSKEQLLGEMKSKTRYNINVARKHGVKILKSEFDSDSESNSETQKKYVDAFLKLTKEMAKRQGITTHPEEYYRKMIENLPAEMLKIYVAEYQGPASTRGGDRSSTRGGKIITANLVLFYGETVIYLHGASANENRNVMAPFLLQWQAILDAKKKGFKYYDFGGVRTQNNTESNGKTQINSWEGITNFKLGFSPDTKPLVFPGSYDIIVNPRKYAIYRGLQRAKAFAVKFRK